MPKLEPDKVIDFLVEAKKRYFRDDYRELDLKKQLHLFDVVAYNDLEYKKKVELSTIERVVKKDGPDIA